MKKIFILFCLSFLFTTTFSQNITGFGTIVSQTGTLIPNAIVSVSPIADTSIVYNYISDKNGNYSFDFPENGSEYNFHIVPSQASLQFDTLDITNVNLHSGSINIKYAVVTLTNTNGIKLVVTDTAGNPVSDAKVTLYSNKYNWRIDSCRIAKPFYTDTNGEIQINSLLPIQYWFNIKKDYQTNRFTTYATDTIIDTTQTTTTNVIIRDLTQNEFYLCGLCDNKMWITDSMVIMGFSQPYDADSKLLSDGTWWDSNGNHGYWWFNPGETTMTYDYDQSSTNGGGSQVDATNLTITDSTFVGDMNMSGVAVTYYMHAEYDTVNLTLEAPDTMLYIYTGQQVNLSTDDLFLNSSYCPTCITTLSQTSFDINNSGLNTVIVTMTDRCGNSVSDTMTVSVVVIGGINTISTVNDIRIFPNPANDYLTIESDKTKITDITLLNINGQIIKHSNINNSKTTLDISDLKQGIYLIKIITKNNTVIKKLIVK